MWFWGLGFQAMGHQLQGKGVSMGMLVVMVVVRIVHLPFSSPEVLPSG